jgi:hypothetical protein
MEELELDLFGNDKEDFPQASLTKEMNEKDIISSDIHNRSPTDKQLEVVKNFDEKGSTAKRPLSPKALREMSYQLKFKSPPPASESKV